MIRLPEVPALPDRLRRALPQVVAGAMLIAGLVALGNLASGLDPAAVTAQLAATPPAALALALLATFASYAALVGYDWTALGALGRRPPFGVLALAGFAGFGIGNTVGPNALTGAAVRARVYARAGLDGWTAASVAAVGSLASGLGAAILGLGALALDPTALDALVTLDPGLVRLGAGAAAAALCGGLATLSLRGSALRLGRFRLAAPPPRALALAALLTVLDVGLAALTLHLLLGPGAPPLLAFLPVFAAATLAGVASHAPGGLGAFEAVALAATPGVAPAHAAAALVLFRLIYNLVPFALALALLGGRELRAAPAPAAEAMRPSVRAARLRLSEVVADLTVLARPGAAAAFAGRARSALSASIGLGGVAWSSPSTGS